MTRNLRLLSAISLIAFAPLGAQNGTTPSSPAATAAKSQILGVVVDSLNGRALAGAAVVIDGRNETAETDSAGKFSFDSIPPGTYRLGVFHPLLDTLNLSIVTRPFHVGPDSASVVVMAIPSAETIVRDRCSDVWNQARRSAVGSPGTELEFAL